MTQLRAVIYARYSSDLQREESIQDQIEVCRRYAEAHGWLVLEHYTDAAISGSSRFRPAFQKLLADAELHKFEIVVCEALDRLGRRLADTADLQDQLAFQKIKLFTPSLGEITPIHVAVMGMMAQMAIKDLGEKTKRGQLGRVLKGRIPAGISYGYKAITMDTNDRGGRTINESEAAIVRQVFHDYAGGKTPEAIAKELNAKAIPGPGGRPWSNTTIRGQVDRGTGVLNNSLYRGVLEWNRCSYVKNPKTGKRVARPNPVSLRETVEIAHLRIIDDELWQKAKSRQGRIGSVVTAPMARSEPNCENSLNATHRPRFLLSGLLRCGCCNGPYSITSKDRFSCSNRKQKGTCENSMTITRQEIEARVLVGLKDRLLAPDLVENFVTAFQEELRLERDKRTKAKDRVDRQLAEIGRKVSGIMGAIEDGLYEPSMKQRLAALKEEKSGLLAQEAWFPEPDVKVLTHPKLAEVYRRKVANLESLLVGEDYRPALELIRSMIENVILTPNADRTALEATLVGDLESILNICAEVSGKRELPDTGVSGSQLSVVAGARFELTTFRL